MPEGQSVEGVEVLACVPTADGAACDADRSRLVNLTGTGRTASFDVGGLVMTSVYLLAGKDVNGNDLLDEGDLLGGVLDAQGNYLKLTPPAANLSVTLATVPPKQSAIPAGLAGTWSDIGSSEAFVYTLNADASYSSAVRYEPGSCVSISLIEIKTAGEISVQGDTLTLQPRSGEYKTVDCSGVATREPPSTVPIVRRFALGTEAGTGRATLTLTDPATPTAPPQIFTRG